MTDKMRALRTYLQLQIKEAERLMWIARGIHDTVAANKWEAVADAYRDCSTRIFGNNGNKDDD